jgi:hypothetical protein
MNAAAAEKANAGESKAADFEEDPPRATDTTGKGNNSEARMKAMDEALQGFYALQKEEDALLALHIQPLRDKKRDIKADLKKDHAVPTAAFNARAGLYIVERDDEDEIVLAVNELFRAVPVGQNVDLIDLGARVEKKRAEKAAAKSKVQAAVEKPL